MAEAAKKSKTKPETQEAEEALGEKANVTAETDKNLRSPRQVSAVLRP
jgi:hypothetical protein